MLKKIHGLRGDFLFSGINFGFKLINNLIIFSILARIIDLDDFGLLSYLVMLSAIAFTVLEFGHRFIVIKEVTANVKIATAEYVSNKVFLKNVLFAIVGGVMLSFCWYKSFWNLNVVLLGSFFMSAYFLSIARLNIALFHSISKFYLETLILIINMAFLMIGIGLVYYTDDWTIFLIFYTLGNLAMMLLSLFFVKKNYSINLESYFTSYSKSTFLPELSAAIPFAAIILGDICFSSIDSFFVEQFFSQKELGIYEGLKKILVGLSILTMILGTALMPWVSRTIKSGIVKSYRNILLAFFTTVSTGVCIFLLYVYFNDIVVELLLGEKFMEITTWDTHIGMFVFSKYLMVIPTLYLIMSGLHNTRLVIIYIMALISIIVIYFYAIPYGMKTTFKMVTYINLMLAIVYALVFFYYMLPSQQNKLKSVNI